MCMWEMRVFQLSKLHLKRFLNFDPKKKRIRKMFLNDAQRNGKLSFHFAKHLLDNIKGIIDSFSVEMKQNCGIVFVNIIDCLSVKIMLQAHKLVLFVNLHFANKKRRKVYLSCFPFVTKAFGNMINIVAPTIPAAAKKCNFLI